MPNSASSFDKETRLNNLAFLSLAIPLLIALWLVIVYFGNYINPKHFMQLPQNIREEYITSLFFRADTWHFPLTITKNIGQGIPLSLTDSIPILAIIFKLFQIHTMQYFGFWIAFSYILTTFFAYRISKNISNNVILSGLGAILFITVPFSWYHTSYTPWMAGQWTILWAFSLFFKRKKHTSLEWYGVLITSCLIHPYLAFVCFFIMLSDLFHLYIYNHSISALKTVTTFSYLFTISLFILSISGTFYLTSFVNPNILLPIHISEIPILTNYNMSYNSLGIGILIGLGISLLMIIRFPKTSKYIKYFMPLIFSLIIFILLSLSNGIIFKNYIFYLPLGHWFYQYIAPIFTSSVKFLIPILWLAPIILVQTAVVLEKKWHYFGIIFISIISLIQLFTFNPAIYQEKTAFYSLSTTDKEFLKNTHSLIWIFNDRIPLRPFYYEPLAYYAYQHKIPINAAPIIRFPTHYKEHLIQDKNNFFNKLFQTKATYIIPIQDFPDNYYHLGQTYQLSHFILFRPYI